MQEQRHKERERDIVHQADAEVEVLAEPDRVIRVKDECRETDRREMQHERRAAALLEKHEKPDPEPYQPDEAKKDHLRRPPRKGVDMF